MGGPDMAPPSPPSRVKVLFYGTPAFALPAFQAVRDAHTIVGVVTQPDRPAHRGQKLHFDGKVSRSLQNCGSA